VGFVVVVFLAKEGAIHISVLHEYSRGVNPPLPPNSLRSEKLGGKTY
jgi:hypothetical protein